MFRRKPQLGDIVKASCPRAHLASSDARTYESAVVVSMEPFVLVAEDLSMLWYATPLRGNYTTTARASGLHFDVCRERYTPLTNRQFKKARRKMMRTRRKRAECGAA